MSIKYSIAGYCRISVDEEMDRDNTSIENQKAIIADFVKRKFPDSTLDFYEDRDRSGYTFEQREGYQELRKKMLRLEYDILIIKDFSRFSRRNSKGLVELEDLRDAGMRIISIGDNIDYPTYDDWTAIQFRFLINEMPVTDTSKKVKSVIKRRQEEGKWICAVPYGYVMINNKNTLAFEVIANSAMNGVISADKAVMLISVLARAVGTDGMIGGQVIDLKYENKEIDVDTLNILQTCKTGALIEAACVMGVILGDKLEAIPFAADYAQAMGRAFQIVDDILDVTGTFEELGKPIGSDSEQHKNTYVSLLGLDKSEQIAKQLTVQALGHLKYFEDSVFLTELTSDMLTRRS